jgi:hypothetical protein
MSAKRERKAAIARYAEAVRALCENSIAEYMAGIDWETPRFLELNAVVAVAEAFVPAWRQRLIVSFPRLGGGVQVIMAGDLANPGLVGGSLEPLRRGPLVTVFVSMLEAARSSMSLRTVRGTRRHSRRLRWSASRL